ncbi:MAG: hypothetical protein ACHRXM_31385 [Isosphaerales bacterium]
MRRSLIGKTATRGCPRSALPSAHPQVSRWFLVLLLAGLLAPAGLRAQTQADTSGTTTKAAAPDAVPLSHFVPKDNLILYVEFAGLDAHADSWKNTAAYKMLNETPLGEMLEQVAGQLLDKALSVFPNHKLSGAEIVTLAKHSARSGWVLAINANPKGPDLARGTFVLRGAISKGVKPLASRLMGWMMGIDAKPKIAEKGGRTLIVVPAAGARTSTSTNDPGWVWWAEKNDLVVGFIHPTSADAIIAALDGKSQSAFEHPQVQQLAKPEGRFQPVCIAFADMANCPEMPDKSTAFLRKLNTEWGIRQIDFRWGFDADALMAVTRLVAPRPRKPGLALFDGAAFEKTSLLAMPDGVESFIELSISPSQLLETVKQIAPDGDVKEQIDEMAESIRRIGQIDLQKDLLAHLGPKMVAYLGAGQSAATNDDSLESALGNGWSPTAAVAAMQSVFPKLTLVAEVSNPELFSKGLDVAINAINGEIKAQAMEKVAEEQRAAAQKGEGGAAGRNQGGRRPAPAGDRTKRRRSLHDTPAPRFTLTPTPGKVKSFVLMTHNDSPIRYGPPSFRPTIQLDGKYVAFAVSPDAARAALAAVQRKDWKPSSGLERACESLPQKLNALFVNDVSDSLPSLLASLPGTLQTMINTSIALANARAGKGQTTAGPGQPGGAMSGPAGAEDRGRRRFAPAGAAAGSGGPGAAAQGGPGRGPPGGRRGGAGGPGKLGGIVPAGGQENPAAASTEGGSTGDSMVVLKVDPDKLPKADDLKAHLFPSTLCIAVSDQEIRFVSRGAFPNLSLSAGLAPIAAAMPAMRSLFDHAKPPQDGAAGSPAVAGGAPGETGSQPAANAVAAPRPARGQPATSRGAPPAARAGSTGQSPN